MDESIFKTGKSDNYPCNIIECFLFNRLFKYLINRRPTCLVYIYLRIFIIRVVIVFLTLLIYYFLRILPDGINDVFVLKLIKNTVASNKYEIIVTLVLKHLYFWLCNNYSLHSPILTQFCFNIPKGSGY